MAPNIPASGLPSGIIIDNRSDYGDIVTESQETFDLFEWLLAYVIMCLWVGVERCAGSV